MPRTKQSNRIKKQFESFKILTSQYSKEDQVFLDSIKERLNASEKLRYLLKVCHNLVSQGPRSEFKISSIDVKQQKVRNSPAKIYELFKLLAGGIINNSLLETQEDPFFKDYEKLVESLVAINNDEPITNNGPAQSATSSSSSSSSSSEFSNTDGQVEAEHSLSDSCSSLPEFSDTDSQEDSLPPSPLSYESFGNASGDETRGFADAESEESEESQKKLIKLSANQTFSMYKRRFVNQQTLAMDAWTRNFIIYLNTYLENKKKRELSASSSKDAKNAASASEDKPFYRFILSPESTSSFNENQRKMFNKIACLFDEVYSTNSCELDNIAVKFLNREQETGNSTSKISRFFSGVVANLMNDMSSERQQQAEAAIVLLNELRVLSNLLPFDAPAQQTVSSSSSSSSSNMSDLEQEEVPPQSSIDRWTKMFMARVIAYKLENNHFDKHKDPKILLEQKENLKEWLNNVGGPTVSSLPPLAACNEDQLNTFVQIVKSGDEIVKNRAGFYHFIKLFMPKTNRDLEGDINDKAKFFQSSTSAINSQINKLFDLLIKLRQQFGLKPLSQEGFLQYAIKESAISNISVNPSSVLMR